MCSNCQKDSSISRIYYAPDEIEEEELDEYGFTIIDNLEIYNSEYDDED
jgi:hypothetical protein